MLAFLPCNGGWCQQAVLRKLISTDCPTGLSWSLASGWVQLTGSVGVRLENRWMEKLGQSLSPASSWFGQWIPYSTAGFFSAPLAFGAE